MCGIFGYIGEKEAVPILINGLKRLEYRGYDSAGVCILNNSLHVIKEKGKIIDLEKLPVLKELNGKIGIAHTRWATHGVPNKINAHPHIDCKGEIALVHNGIIENYATLKKLLKEEGHVFKTDTDTEVLVHLIEKFYNGNLEEAVRKALLEVEGTYGIAVVHKNENKIVVAKNGSSLILGIGDKENFVASDASPIIEHTKNVIYLNDKDIAVLTKDNYTLLNLNKLPVDAVIQKLDLDIKKIERQGYEHFMLKEIFEQPEIIKNTLRGRVSKGKIKLSLNLNEKYLKKLKRIIITACGTSWHSALIGEYLIESLAKVPVEVEYASEFRYRNPVLNKDDLVIAISQSGETADTLAALKKAKEAGCKTLGIVNVVGSAIAREAGAGIYIHAGPEIGVASTKAFTGQISCLLAFTLLLVKLKKTMEKENLKQFIKDLEKMPALMNKVLEKNSEIKEIAEDYYKNNNFLYLGRGLNFPVALEGALKLKEISYIHAEGYPAAEMKHGPIALIDKDMPVVFLATDSEVYDKVVSNMQEIKARNGKIIAIATEGDERIKEFANNIIYIPKVNEYLSPLVNVLPLQLLAYYMAVLRGCNVDQPRNLAKSVTVE